MWLMLYKKIFSPPFNSICAGVGELYCWLWMGYFCANRITNVLRDLEASTPVATLVITGEKILITGHHQLLTGDETMADLYRRYRIYIYSPNTLAKVTLDQSHRQYFRNSSASLPWLQAFTGHWQVMLWSLSHDADRKILFKSLIKDVSLAWFKSADGIQNKILNAFRS